MTDDERFMRRCIELAAKAAENGDVPVGAVVVRGSIGEVIGEGFNRRELDRSALAHAELIAIEEASKRLGGWHLTDCTLYVTLEPCAMCAGAIVNSRVDRLVFGAADLRFGACGSRFDLFSVGLNHLPSISRGVLGEECSEQIKAFFRELRARGKRYENKSDT